MSADEPHSVASVRRSENTAASRMWLPLNALRAFEAVGTQLSFKGAAASLHVSQSALSRHVGRLEELLGQQLLERRPSGVVLTKAGATLLPILATSFDRIEAAIQALRHDGASGPRIIRLHIPPTFLQVVGLELLREFRAAFPDILIDVSSSNGIGMPRRKGLELAVVFDRPQVDDAVRDLLWLVDCTPACAPALAERCAGMDLREFISANELLHTKLEGEPLGTLWSEYGRQYQIEGHGSRGLAFDNEALAVQWAIAGGGVVLLDKVMWSHEFAAGRLVAPFDATRPSGFAYYLAVHPDDLPDPAIALFRSWLIQRFAMRPGTSADEPTEWQADEERTPAGD